MAQGKGYWVKGSKIYPVSVHIDYIISHPSAFNTSKDKLKELYKKYKEPFGLEGKARNEIIIKAMKDGWLRVRHNKGRNDFWSIQCDNYKKRKSLIKSFVKKMFLDEINQYDDLVITGIEDKYYERISADKFFKENKEVKEIEMILESMYNNIFASTNG